MTQKEALEQALKDLGGRAHLQDIYPVALKYITHKEGSKIYDSLRGCIHDKRRFRPSPDKPRGWYELLSYQEEISKLKQKIQSQEGEISYLKAKIETLEKRQTVEDFVKSQVKTTKQLFMVRRGDADSIRQILGVVGYAKEAEELAAWIEYKENRLTNAVEKIADRPAVQVDVKDGAHAQISEQGITNHYPQLENKENKETI